MMMKGYIINDPEGGKTMCKFYNSVDNTCEFVMGISLAEAQCACYNGEDKSCSGYDDDDLYGYGIDDAVGGEL